MLNSSGVQEKRRARTTRNTSKDHHKAIHRLPEIHLTLCAWSNLLIDLHHCLSSNRPHKAARKTRGLYCLTHWNFQPLMDKFRFVLSIETQNSSNKTSMVYHFFDSKGFDPSQLVSTRSINILQPTSSKKTQVVPLPPNQKKYIHMSASHEKSPTETYPQTAPKAAEAAVTFSFCVWVPV